MTPKQNTDTASSAAADDGTKILGILSIIFAFVCTIAGLILAIVGTSKAKDIKEATGHEAQGAGLLKIGLICSIVMIALGFLIPLIVFVLLVPFWATLI